MAKKTKVVSGEEDSPKSSGVDKDIELLMKKHGSKIQHLGLAGDNTKNMNMLSTGSLLLDYRIAFGGIPQGRITHIFGPPKSLKTTLAVKAIKSAYDKYTDPLCMVLDFERTQDSKDVINYYRYLGLTEAQARNIIIARDVPEKCFDLAEDFVRHNRSAVLVVDSIGAMEPSASYEKSYDENAKVAGRALLVKRFLNRINTVNNNCAVILLNQVIDNFGGGLYGPQYTYGGGNALKHMASLSLDVKGYHTKDNKTDKGAVNTKIQLGVKIDKCKVGGEGQNFPIVFDLATGNFDKTFDCLALGYELGLLDQRGAWYFFLEEPGSDALLLKTQGRESFEYEIANNPELLAYIERFVISEIESNRKKEFNVESFISDDESDELSGEDSREG